MRLAGRVAVVTGAARGLGRRICEAMVGEGARVAYEVGVNIVNVSSESVLRPYPTLGVYAATKSALETLSRSLRGELRGEGIRVTVLRAGRMGESGFNRGWPADLLARYREVVAREGFHAASGEPIRPAVAAAALVDLLCLPREAQAELIELRPV